MNTIEGNKLIAVFDGAELSTEYPAIVYHSKVRYIDDLKYHSSWDWLMPVVEKIESLGEYQIEIDLYSCYVIETSKLVTPEKCFVVESHEDSKIKAVWQAVIQFIQWYNSEQSVKESDTSKAT